MLNKMNINKTKLYLFSCFIAIITYGFALTNYTLTVDSESPIYPWFSLEHGRWGTNLIRYHIFNGHLPYFTMLLGLLALSLTAVELTKIFKFTHIKAYVFCALFICVPQMAYQLVFTMQADVVPIGFLAAVTGTRLYIENYSSPFIIKKYTKLSIAALLIMFAVACYQALALVPVVIFLIYFFQETFSDSFDTKSKIKELLFFGLLMISSAILYYISVKIICPPGNGGYLSSYTSGNANRLKTIASVLHRNLTGSFYYGNRLFPIAVLLLLAAIYKTVKSKKHTLIRIIALLCILILPYGFSFLITSGYHPPRIYLTTGIVFAFILVHFLPEAKFQKQYIQFCALICIVHIYFITSLFHSANSIYNHDKETAKKIDQLINKKYPEFNPAKDYVYFYGCLPWEHHNKYRLENSEIFGGSLFNWDNGNNWRIINFFKVTDVADFRFMDYKPSFDKAKDSIESMPTWPNSESVKKVGDVILVKLGTEKGVLLPFEQ